VRNAGLYPQSRRDPVEGTLNGRAGLVVVVEDVEGVAAAGDVDDLEARPGLLRGRYARLDPRGEVGPRRRLASARGRRTAGVSPGSRECGE
jgi:hypothetical protein